MKLIAFFIFSTHLLLLSSQIILAQGFELVGTLNSNIYSPSEIFVLDEDRIVTVELTNKYGVLNLIDFNTGEVLASRPAGRGPGEFSQNGKKLITLTNDNSLWVWDNGRRRGFIFDKDLNYHTDVISNDKSVTDAIHLNDSTIVVRKMFSTNTVFCKNKLNGNRISDESFHCFNSESIKNLESIKKNPLLNQGPMAKLGGKAYIGFNFTSTILSIAAEYGTDTLQTPYFIPFPEVGENRGQTIEAPDHGENPKTTIDIASDGENIYILYSGEKFETNLIKQFTGYITGELAHEMEKSDNASDLFVFDKETGKFIESLTLPNISKRIEVYGDYFYTLSYVDKNYVVNKYRLK
ncbi:MAG: hypothetical protein WD512_10815 [Candidatus Paceibacterota bacterium]